MIKSINPATGKTVKTYTALDSAGIEAALVQAGVMTGAFFVFP